MMRRVARWVVVGCGVVLLLGFMTYRHLERMRQSAGRQPCPSALRQIGQAIQLYANAWDGFAPPSLDVALVTQGMDPKQLLCPVSGKKYVYCVEPGTRVSELGSDVIVAHDALDAHGGDGGMALFGDGHVEFLTEPALKTLLAATRPVVGGSGEGGAATRGSSGQ